MHEMNTRQDEVLPEPKEGFFAAIEEGDLATVQSYLERDASLANAIDNRVSLVSDRSWEERSLRIGAGFVDEQPKPQPRTQTALHVAVKHNRLEVVRLLVAHGADVNAVTKSQQTPLHYATTYKFLNLELIQFLVEHGANVNGNGPGSTPLYRAFRWDRDPLPVVEFLLENGADVNAASRDRKRTPVDMAVFLLGSPTDHLPLIEVLLRFGADVNPVPPNTEREPPLPEVALHGNVPVARLLLAAGADPNATGPWGTALHMAAHDGYDRMVELLLDAGGDPHALDKDGRTPLNLTQPYEETLERIEHLLSNQSGGGQ